MQDSYDEYIKLLRIHQVPHDQQVNSLSDEVQEIIKEGEKDEQCVSLKLQPFLQQFVTFEEGNGSNELITTDTHGYSVFNVDAFADEIDLNKKVTIDILKPYIKQLLSIRYKPLLQCNKLSLCLMITTIIEKRLTSLHKQHSNTVLPRTFSEILVFMYNEHILPSNIINLCVILIGPPTGINLRNLLWHGFMNEEQITDTLFCSLVLLYQTIMNIEVNDIHHKELKQEQIEYFNQYVEIPLDNVFEELMKCPYVIPCRKDCIVQCLNALRQDNINRDISLLRLFIEFEHFLRVSFIAINDVTIKFGLANYSSYYTTLAVLLQEMIVSNADGIAVNRPSTVNDIKIAKYKNTKKYGNSDSNGTTFEKKPNQLITILGNEVIIKLHDLFLNEGGIKLRDNLSHGEYDIHSFPTTVDNTMIFIYYFITN